jgi:hypothetical protein
MWRAVLHKADGLDYFCVLLVGENVRSSRRIIRKYVRPQEEYKRQRRKRRKVILRKVTQETERFSV